MLNTLLKELHSRQDPEKSKASSRFFKTGKGEYGEGDMLLGITVPEQRKIAKKYSILQLSDVDKLLKNKLHECRCVALLILVDQFKQSGKNPSTIFNFYLSHTKYINNWDLVDLSAPRIVGAYLQHKNRDILATLARSQNLWERRIAIVSTYSFICSGDYKTTFLLSDLLMSDKHDLIHKAVGWMLREVGKRCGQNILEEYLKSRYKKMPRTMLRYAIEHFPEKRRQYYLKSK